MSTEFIKNTEILRKEISDLESTLEVKKNQLLILKLEALIGYSTNLNKVTNIKIKSDKNSGTWEISYTHETEEYTSSYYDIIPVEDINDSENKFATFDSFEESKTKLTSNIIFGKGEKYYMIGGPCKQIEIYRVSDRLKLKLKEHIFMYTSDEHIEIIDCYSTNNNIPEWFALSIFLFLNKSKWTEKEWLAYISK